MLQKEVGIEYTIDANEGADYRFMHLTYHGKRIPMAGVDTPSMPKEITRFIYVRCIDDLLVLINHWNHQPGWKYWY